MFSYATDFNQLIANWNTKNMTTMKGMFYRAVFFEESIPEEWYRKFGVIRNFYYDEDSEWQF
jgi:surface protein